MDVNKVTLIDQLVEKHSYTKKAATSVVEDFMDIVVDNIRDGNRVCLNGFGRFELKKKEERTYRSPITGELIRVDEHWSPKFYPGTWFKIAAKEWEDNRRRGLI